MSSKVNKYRSKLKNRLKYNKYQKRFRNIEYKKQWKQSILDGKIKRSQKINRQNYSEKMYLTISGKCVIVRMLSLLNCSRLVGIHKRYFRKLIDEKIIPRPIYCLPSGKLLYTWDQYSIIKRLYLVAKTTEDDINFKNRGPLLQNLEFRENIHKEFSELVDGVNKKRLV